MADPGTLLQHEIREAKAAGPQRATTSSLRDALTAAILQGSHARVQYLHSKSKHCESLYSPLHGSRGEDTRQTSHFLTVSTPSTGKDSSQCTLIYAVEVLTYTTARLTTLFVSKADSTGFREHGRPLPIRAITTTFLEWLIDAELRRRPSRPLVVSLFGRAQGAYLFPGSEENSRKHVLDDRQLVKWWAKALNPLLSSTSNAIPRHGYITVPGYQSTELRQFLPVEHTSWTAGNPLQQLASIRGLPEHAPTRCLLPRFPDDPKARFIQDLDDEVGLHEDAGASAVLSPSKRKDGRWKTIHSLDRFWESMEFRQECSSGRVVGFLWLLINARSSRQHPSHESSPSRQTASRELEGRRHVVDTDARQKKRRKQKQLRGLITVRRPKVKGALLGPAPSHDHDGDGLLISSEGYDQAMQTLSHLDFATIEAATNSTNKWLAEVTSFTKIPTAAWTLDITGTAEPLAQVSSSSRAGVVNDLGSMIRKKKRPNDDALVTLEASDRPVSCTTPQVNTLGSGLIRKKAKVV